MENRAAHPHQEPAGMKTLRSSLNSVRCVRSEVQWNPALRPLFLTVRQNGHTFSCKKKRTFVNVVTR